MKVVPASGSTPIPNASLPSGNPTYQERRARALAIATQGEGAPAESPASGAPRITAVEPPKTGVHQYGATQVLSTRSAPTEAPEPSYEAPEPTPEAPAPIQADSSEPEAPAEAPTGEVRSAEAPQLSPQYAELARKEKALRAKVQAQETALRQREEALAAREAAMRGTPAQEAPARPASISVEDLLADPIGVLQQAGLDYNAITERAMQPGMDPATRAYLSKLEAKIATLESETKGTKQSLEEGQQNQYKQAVAQIRREAESLVKTSPEFESIKETDSVDDVVDLIERTFKEDGILMSVEEAAQEIENELTERLIAYTTKIKKVNSKFQQGTKSTEAPAPSAQQSASTQQQQPQMKTLTNAHGTSRPLTARERALAAFKGIKQ